MTDSTLQATPDRTSHSGTGDGRRYLLPVIFLTIILIAQLALLYLFTRPQSPVGAETDEWHVMSIYGFGPERMWEPSEVAVDSERRIYVADTNKHRILMFDRAGSYEGMIYNQGEGPGEFQFPSDVDVDGSGRVYVTSTRQNKIIVFSRDHQPVREIEIPDPLAVTIKGERMYVTTDREIMIGDLDGNKISGFGTRGRGDGQIDRPSGIAVDDEGVIYIADTLNYRVSAYTEEGEVIWHQGDSPARGEDSMQSKDRTYGLPVGLALGEDGLLYLVDAFNGEIHQLSTEDGRPLDEFGEWGSLDGQLYYPSGISHAWGNTFVVADRYNNRVQLLSMGDAPGPALPFELPIWLALLPLLLLPLLPFLGRRRMLLADHAALDRVIGVDERVRFARRYRSILVTPDALVRLERDERARRLLRSLGAVQPAAELVDEAKKAAPDLSDEGAWIAAGAASLKRARVLTDDEALTRLLDAEGVIVLSSDEILGKRGDMPEVDRAERDA